MATCMHCNQPAGFFSRMHPACKVERDRQRADREQVRAQIWALLHRAFEASADIRQLADQANQLAQSAQVNAADFKNLAVHAWIAMVDRYLEDGILSDDEERSLSRFRNHFALDAASLDRGGALTRCAKAGVLRDLVNGVMPRQPPFQPGVLVNLQKNERVIWAFPNTRYLEDKTRREMRGTSHGVSIRVMKGIYYRVGASEGRAVEFTERQLVDTGELVITNKHLIFAGPAKSVRVPHSKIVAVQPYEDGFGIMRDAQNAKAQVFITGDGWFCHNLMANVQLVAI
jgi:hypothetical protein